MPRRLRPLTIDRLDALPAPCVSCVFWESPERLETVCGAKCDPEALRAWYLGVSEEWGDCGRVAAEDDRILGFIKYAPVRYVPQARNLPGHANPDTPIITCMHIIDEARSKGLGSVLLHSVLHDLRTRGERSVLAYACAFPADMAQMPMVGMEFLLRNGFTVQAPHRRYPLMRLDLRATLPWPENLEAVLESLRIPLRAPRRVPTTYTGSK